MAAWPTRNVINFKCVHSAFETPGYEATLYMANLYNCLMKLTQLVEEMNKKLNNENGNTIIGR